MLIATSGFATTGKTEAAKGLYPKFELYAFADELKIELAATLGVTLEELAANKEKYRDDMVALGASRRAEDADYWVKLIAPKVEADLAAGRDVVVHDLRYVNEAQWIHRLGGHVVMIQRPDVGPANAEEARSINEIMIHKSFNSIVRNNGTIEQLHKKINALVQMYRMAEEEQ